MRLMIIRHGEPDYAHDTLTEKGFREVELLSRRLVKANIIAAYVSPLGRAQDTARPTLEKLGMSAETLEWLCEYRGTSYQPFSEKRRVPWNLMPQYWMKQDELFSRDQWLEHGLMKTGNVGEIYKETCEGMDALLAGFGYARDGYIYRCEKNIDGTIALFCHFGVGLAILGHLLGASVSWMWQSLFLPVSSVTTLVTEERIKGEVFLKCMQVGDTSHLYAADEPVSSSGLYPEFWTPQA